VHIAHRELILAAKERAASLSIPLGVFTFPAENEIKSGAARLYSTTEKLGIFEKLGVDFTVLADFPSVSSLSPEEFVREVLVGDVGANECFAGFNFRFGKGAVGDARLLAELMEQFGGSATVCKERKLEGETVSASLIREKILNGDTDGARALLGAPYFLKGKVEHGDARGKKLGFPTVNTAIEAGRVMPRPGVYVSAVTATDRLLPAITNIGFCPTFGAREAHAETFILNFEGDLYGEDIEIHLLRFLRDEKCFSSAEELIMQINIDKNTAIKELENKKWQELGLN